MVTIANQINFSSLLPLLKQSQFIEQHPVVCFTASSYPLLFFSLIINKLKNRTMHTFKTIDLETISITELKAQLEVSFLGQSYIYWCSDLSILDLKQKKDLCTYLNTYRGPHSVWFFTNQRESTVPDSSFFISLPEQISWTELHEYQILFNDENFNTQNIMMKHIFKKKQSLLLDECALFINYFNVLSKHTFNEFLVQWFDTLTEPEKSLFDLSSHFFAKNKLHFFMLWKHIASDYAVPFWFVYWSDQLFRAAAFVYFSNKQDFKEAKRIAYKLPFSFIKRDWKRYTFEELMQAHTALYGFDYHLKNGGSESNIESFYHIFLSNTYSRVSAIS